jgi:HD-GYP domain-containing protein (c-di-GMP phosphodiesterase class II)
MRVESNHLEVGMYVCELDRPWLDSPFMFQGFRVETDAQLRKVRKFCDFVYVDQARSGLPEAEGPVLVRPDGVALETPEVRRRRFPKRHLELTDRPIALRYPIKAKIEEELPKASAIRKRAVEEVHELFHCVESGRLPDTRGALESAKQMVESIIRNPDAMVWMSQLKDKDQYTAIHCVNVCTLAVAFGRHLGMPEGELFHLGLGALLHDLGKLRVPSDILNKPGKLTRDEFTVMKQHPTEGKNLLMSSGVIPDASLEVAYTHHERMDGRGYPRGLKGHQLSLFTKIVAIVDVYDALTSERVYHEGMSAEDALGKIYEWGARDLDADLVEKFIQSVGLFPVGCQVELTDGQIGVVLEANRLMPRRPKVLILLDSKKRRLSVERVLDMAKEASWGRDALNVGRVLPMDEYALPANALTTA